MPATKLRKRPVGRPYIGPQVSTAIPEIYHKRIEREAERRGVPEAVVVREYLLAGMAP